MDIPVLTYIAMHSGLLPSKPTKHKASKKNAEHQPKQNAKKRANRPVTNHQRVVFLRALRMGISADEYKAKFCNS